MRVRPTPAFTNAALFATTAAAFSFFGLGRFVKQLKNDSSKSSVPLSQSAFLRESLSESPPGLRISISEERIQRVRLASRARERFSVEDPHLFLPVKDINIRNEFAKYLKSEIDISLKTFVSSRVHKINGCKFFVVIGFDKSRKEEDLNLYQTRSIRIILFKKNGAVTEIKLPVQKVADIIGESVDTYTPEKYILKVEGGEIRVADDFIPLAKIKQEANVRDLKGAKWISYDFLVSQFDVNDKPLNDPDLTPKRSNPVIGFTCPP